MWDRKRGAMRRGMAADSALQGELAFSEVAIRIRPRFAVRREWTANMPRH